MIAPPAAVASNWHTAVAGGSSGESQAQPGPATPTGVVASCVSALGSNVTVTWTSVPRATTYSVYQSTTSATTGYTLAASGVVPTSWTSGSLVLGGYWFEVAALIGSKWQSANSSATAERLIVVLACL